MGTNVADQGKTFTMTDTKLYVPVVTWSAKDNAQLLVQLKMKHKEKITIDTIFRL